MTEQPDVQWVYAQLCSMTCHPNFDITEGQRAEGVHDPRRGWARDIVRRFRREPHAETIAAAFHLWYERLAPNFGYETRRESSVPWQHVPDENRKLMVAVVNHLIAAGLIR